jgi:hypothetical protein
VEPHTLAFEDIHAVAVRLAAKRLSDLQNRVADREARKLSQTVRAQRAEVKVQIQRIAFINEVAKLVGDDCFGFHLATGIVLGFGPHLDNSACERLVRKLTLAAPHENPRPVDLPTGS